METEQNLVKKHWHYSFWRCTGWMLLGVIGFSAFIILAGLAIMWLWNMILPGVFGLGLITFWQAVGLAVLARLLFGCSHRGWHRRGKGRWGHGHKYFGHHGYNSCCNGSYEHDHMHKGDKDTCNCDSSKWQYYDKFWEEEGEQLFNDYAKRKMDKAGHSEE